MTQYIVERTGPNTFRRVKVTAESVKNVPGYAIWTIAEMEAWIDAEVTDLASAKVAIKGLATMIVLMRDELFPGISSG